MLRLVTIAIAASLCACGVDETTLDMSRKKSAADAMVVAHANGCLNCHAVGSSIVGPAWILVAKRYQGSPDARAYLIEKIKKGGNGAWNDITGGAKMPAHETRVSQAHLEQLVDFILDLKVDEAD